MVQLADRLRKYYKANAINVSKLLHGFRVLGACTLDDAGVPDEVRHAINTYVAQCCQSPSLFTILQGLVICLP